MIQLLDIRFSFFCRRDHKNEKGKNPIILRIKYNGDRRDLFTGLYCFKTDWCSETSKVLKTDKDANTINQNLDLIIRKANNHFDSIQFSCDNFSIDELVARIKGKTEKPTLLINYLQESIERIKNRVGSDLTKSSYYRYSRSLRYMQDFLLDQYNLRNYTLNLIDLKFLETFFHYLRVKKNTCHNTSLKYIAIVKASLMQVIKAGIIKGDPFSELKIKPKPIHVDFLTQEELDKIIFTELSDKVLERKRDIFLFACFTGLSFIDLTKLKSDSFIQDPDGSWYIRTNRQKTGEECIIPLLPAAERILRRYSLSSDLREFRWHITSNQKMNKGLKSIGSLCGIVKPLHMHLARHTFATTITLSNGVPIESVSKMLGHSNIRTTQHYAKVVATKIKYDMSMIRDIYQ